MYGERRFDVSVGEGDREGGRYQGLADRVAAAVLQARGDTDPGLRRAVEERTAALGGGTDVCGPRDVAPSVTEGRVPIELAAYADKVAREAYGVTDEDVAALRRAGYTEDAIFEVTVSAALGAGLARLERGLAALGSGNARAGG